MATLTEVSVLARRIIKFSGVALVVMALIPGTISTIKKIMLALNPPPPTPPTVRYGKLPTLIFPEAPNYATPEYKLETISGGLPALPNVGKVYVVGINRSRLLTLDRMKDKAISVGLKNEPLALDDRTYRFTNQTLPIDMIFDVITGSFSYKYDWTVDREIYTTFDVPIGNSAVSEAQRFLERLGALPDDLAKGTSKIIYLAATSSAMVPENSPYEANFVRVDLFRADKDDVRIVTAGMDTSPANVIISGSNGDKRIIQANYYYSQVIGDDFATYPLRPVTAAWQELTTGGGYIAKRTTEKVVTIRKVSLGYFESNEQQSFLQPVYVFEGDGNFAAFVQAVAPEYVIAK
ncbi:hypothetical protein A2397_04240 [Candidatus Amesbacteria bacterium RIFOXYB1_FULL_44_23]|uniref:Uncharacterized protein n=1 Tax=Candidatus Amesbacteria bacterium RIFOXYB1_FULL_44_23 TaxID=1797263 RepID=A0A1F4ZRR6_9BACT|nr:MAG: hypothetical protein A2397_04240 [Candidatus Amesbacteria bacterium RIFOXYB1_FULL_44_23]